MTIHAQYLENFYPSTIAWLGDDALVDWSQAGEACHLDGQQSQRGQYSFGSNFNRAITSADGTYAFIYQLLGTKGLLLKNGKLLREINRSYYHADVYEYPAVFATVAGATYLVHCPVEYCQLDFEEVETGTLVTDIAGRRPTDFFHSRLEISPAGGYLLSKGWMWHPWDGVQAFDIAACLANPLLLDATELRPDMGSELSTAGFASEHQVVLLASGEEAMGDEDDALPVPPGHLAVWNLQTNEYAPAVAAQGTVGNLFPLNEKLAWDLLLYPKLLDLETGEVVAQLETVATGRQCSSITRDPDTPAIALNCRTGRIAVRTGNNVVVLSFD